MTKKDLSSVTTDLAALAGDMPSQRVVRPETEDQEKLKREEGAKRKKIERPPEPTSQFSFELRKSLRKELVMLATEADMTMRAFVLNALKDKGLTVTDADLIDMRKQKG